MPNLSVNCHQKRESGEKNAITLFAGPYICHLTIVVIKNKKTNRYQGAISQVQLAVFFLHMIELAGIYILCIRQTSLESSC